MTNKRGRGGSGISWTQFITVVMAALLIFVLADFSNKAVAWYHLYREAAELGGRVQAEQAESERLARQAEWVQSPEYRELVARRELKMGWPDEVRVVIVPRSLAEVDSAVEDDRSAEETASRVQEEPHWQKWWRLFFDNSPGSF
ncbi:MAG: septum formation initiator family protein [Anaerolineae bacterium]